MVPVRRSFGGPKTGFGRLLGEALRLSAETRLTRVQAQSPVIYSCIRVNADALAGIPRSVRVGEDEVEDELSALLDRPNPLMGGRQFQRAMSVDVDLAGGFFLFMDSDRAPKRDGEASPIDAGEFPERIWIVCDDLVEPDEVVRGVPRSWRVGSMGKTLKYPDHAVAHVYYPDDADPFRGFGPTQAAWRSADHLFRAEAFDDGLVENGGQIGGYFSHEDKSLKKEQLDTLNKSIAQNASRPQNDRKKIVLPGGVKFTPVAFSPVDMQASEMRRVKRQEIARIYGVPPVMLGELEDANRSSLREQRRVYYENTVIPRADFLMEELYNQFILKLPKEFHDRRIVFDYAATAAMREDMDAQIARMEKLVGLGVPVRAAAEFVGIEIEEYEGDEKRYISTGLKLAEEVDDPEPEAEEPEPPRAVTVTRTRDRRAAAVEAEERRLKTADRRVKKAVRKAFDDYVLAQLKKLRAVADEGARDYAVTRLELTARNARSVREWSWYTESAGWSQATRGYAAVLEYEPRLGADGWVTVRGISEDELAALVLGNERAWGEQLWAALKGPLRGVVEEAATAAREAVGGELISATNPAVLEYLRAKEIQIVEGPMSVVAEQVKRALIAGMADAGQTGTLADRVREAFESLEEELRALQDRLGTRAAMVARTETAAASNAARTEQYKVSGIAQHEWASAVDDLVRAGHDIDGELAIVGEPFSNGLRHPGDPRGAPGDVINCRCLTLAVMQEPAAAAVSGTVGALEA